MFFSQGMPFPGLGHQYAREMRMPFKLNPEHIVHFALIPIGTVVEVADAGNGCGLIRIGLHSDTRIVADAEQIIYDLETLVLSRVINRGDVDNLREFGGGVVFEEGEHGDDARWGDVDGQFVFPHSEPVIGLYFKPIRFVHLIVLTAGCISEGMTSGIARICAEPHLLPYTSRPG